MGAAIGVFEGARALRVPRTRFVPVKTTDDLLVAALRRLRARRATRASRSRRERGGVPPFVDLDAELLQAGRRLRGALPGRPAVARGVRGAAVEGDVRFGARRGRAAAT